MILVSVERSKVNAYCEQKTRGIRVVNNFVLRVLNKIMKKTLLFIAFAIGAFFVIQFGKDLYLKPKNITGAKSLEISGMLPDGSSFALSALNGKYVLLDFWGSWCGPCRRSNPDLVSLYQKYHGQKFTDAEDFEIVSIGLENNASRWQKAIQNDGLIWPYHLMESSSFDSPTTLAYTVKQIPTKFLINPSGVIMAVDPSIKEITKLLDDRM